jgi:hypothetical protein
MQKMKTKRLTVVIPLLLTALIGASALSGHGETNAPTPRTATALPAQTNRPSPAAAEEVFPRLTINGEVYTNVSVIRANPVELVLRWDPCGGGTYKRQDLPPELAARYPYDADAAAKWAREKGLTDRLLSARQPEMAERERLLAQRQNEQLREKQRSSFLKDLQNREARLNAQIQKANKQLEDLNEFLGPLDHKAKGTRRNSPRWAAADYARDVKMALLNQIHQLQDQLDTVHEQMKQYR